MRLLVISDTHGNFPLVLRACQAAAPYDAIIHLGDADDDLTMLGYLDECTLIHVAGNCDMGSSAPRERVWECEGKRLLLVHGDAYGVKGGLARLEKRGKEAGVDAVLFGHTHQATVTSLSGMLAVNPGTLMRGANRTSYAILDITPLGMDASLHDIS